MPIGKLSNGKLDTLDLVAVASDLEIYLETQQNNQKTALREFDLLCPTNSVPEIGRQYTRREYEESHTFDPGGHGRVRWIHHKTSARHSQDYLTARTPPDDYLQAFSTYKGTVFPFL